MTTVTIKDLTTEKELDHKAMSEVSGGNAAIAMADSLGLGLFFASPVTHNVANDQYNIGSQSAGIGGGNMIGDGVFAPVQFQGLYQSNNA